MNQNEPGMLNRQYPLSVDWYLFFVRWPVYLTILTVYLLSVWPYTNPKVVNAAIIGGVVLNLVYLPLLLTSWYTSLVAFLAQVADTVVFMLILYATGQGNSPYYVFAVIPVIAGALRFGPIGGLGTALAMILGYSSMIFLSFGRMVPSNVLLTYVLFILLLLLLAMAPAIRRGMAQTEGKRADNQQKVGELREAHERLKTLYELTRTLSATLNYEQVLNTILDSSIMNLFAPEEDALQISRAVFLYSAKGTLEVAASRHLHPQDQHLTISDKAGLVHRAITSAEPVLAQSASDDPELKHFLSFSDARSLLCIPLRAAFETYGVVLLASPQPRAFSHEQVEMLTAFCNQAVVALQNARLYQSLEQDKQRIIETQDEIRRQLARDLHDGPTQSVSAIAMRLNFTKLLVNREPARAAIELEKLEELARRTAKEIRTMLFTLRPLTLETQGLTAALQQYAEKLKETEGLEIQIDSTLYERLPAKKEGVAFSIIEEAINNARKHARAENIYVRLRPQQDMLVAEVEDDGLGFDLSSVEATYDQRSSLGLVNMKERAALVGGHLTIASEPGKGTQVTLLIPLTDANSRSR